MKDSFIGTKLNTPKGGVLTVLKDNGLKQDKKKYFCECSICSKDKELWPKGSILTSKYSLQSGSIPCGCSVNPKWTVEQNVILIQRKLNSNYKENTSSVNLKVIGTNGWSGSKLRYLVECPVCSKDKELFPKGSLFGSKVSLMRGTLPCSCSESPKWSEDQMRIRVDRLAKDLGYTFNGWASEYKGNITYLDLHNPITGNRWTSTTIDHFFGGRYDPVLGNERSRDASRKAWVGEFRTSNKGGTISVVEDLKGQGVRVFCTKCAEDTELFGDGKFTFNKDVWTGGSTPCGCSPRYKFNKDQQKIRYNRLCNDQYTLVDLYLKENHWYIIRDCRLHGSWTTLLSNAVAGKGCPECSSGGFSKDKPAFFYIVSWKNSANESVLVKFGITNTTVEKRVKTQASKTDLTPEILTTFYNPSGKTVYDVEAEVKRLTKHLRVVDKDLLPDGYTEAFYYNKQTLKELEVYVKNLLKV